MCCSAHFCSYPSWPLNHFFKPLLLVDLYALVHLLPMGIKLVFLHHSPRAPPELVPSSFFEHLGSIGS